MDSGHHVSVPLRYGIKKMRKRRDLDALIAQSHARSGGSLRRCNANSRVVYSQDKLLGAASTDDQEEYVWPRVKQPSHHCGSNKQMVFRLYGIGLFVISLTVFVGFTYWLNFNLQQQIYEYRQKVEQVATTSQILPDTLQTWHETSTLLMKNQTAMIHKLNDLQHALEELWKNFTEYRLSVEARKSYEKEEKLVADFGAKIEAVAADVESMKEHYDALGGKQQNLEATLKGLKANFSEGLRNIAQPVNCTHELEVLRANLLDRFVRVAGNMSYINDTLSQKSTMLQEELVAHKAKLDELLDKTENITSHVTSLENSWPEYKQRLLDCGNNVQRLDKEMAKLSLNAQKKELSIKSICKECHTSYMEALQQTLKMDDNAQRSDLKMVGPSAATIAQSSQLKMQ